jgi:hypothetical protein
MAGEKSEGNDLLSVSTRAIADFKKDLWETLSDGAEGRF